MKKANHLGYYGKMVWIYTKYQMLTKAVLFLAIFPMFNLIVRQLISSSGRVSISSGDYIGFLFSVQGLGFLASALVVLTLLVGIDINAFIIMGALIEERRINVTARSLFVAGLKSLKSLLRPSGILVMLYIVIILPLVSIGTSVSVTENFKTPNFITDVIFNNPLYSTAYFIALLLLTIITIIYIFFFHYLIINNQSIKRALIQSAALMKRHWKSFIKEFFVKLAIIYIVIFSVVAVLIFILATYVPTIDTLMYRRFVTTKRAI